MNRKVPQRALGHKHGENTNNSYEAMTHLLTSLRFMRTKMPNEGLFQIPTPYIKKTQQCGSFKNQESFDLLHNFAKMECHM